MVIDYENYKVFNWTDKQLKKHYSQEILNKYYKQLAFLYQNGYDVNCDTLEEVEEQFFMWDYFNTTENFEEMTKLWEKEPTTDNSVGKKIISEELYEIIKASTFLRKEADNPAIIKSYATTYWGKIGDCLQMLEDLFFSKDVELVRVFSKLKNTSDVKERILFLKEKYEKEIKVLTWLKIAELNNIIYSTYIRLSKMKTDHINISKVSNLNDEIYGGIGGFNPTTGEIKCVIGSAVWETKTIKSTKTMAKIKTIAKSILMDTIKTREDDEGIKYLERWYNGQETDDEKARQVVVCSNLFGILSLLCLKHNFNFLDDPKNSQRGDAIRYEFLKILEYCGIEKEYLL